MELSELKTKVIGRNIIYYKEIDSTQTEMWRQNNLENGTMIIADKQTKGKGTHGRTWHKNCEQDVTFSLKLYMNCNIKKIEKITLDIAEIIIDEFKDLYNIQLEIKEPNDIIKNNKKIGGILTETKVSGNQIKEMVIGIGINIIKQDFPIELQGLASSIENETNIKTDRNIIIAEFCNRFEQLLIKKTLL